MTYSLEHLAFRAVAGVVNTAARAANSLLEVMYPPRYDTAHIWDEPEQLPHEAAAPADFPTAGAADPAGGSPPPPAGSPLTWNGWAEPAIWEVLCAHTPYPYPDFTIHCVDATTDVPLDCHKVCADWEEWREHASSFIADRIACDPTRAVLALTSLQKQ